MAYTPNTAPRKAVRDAARASLQQAVVKIDEYARAHRVTPEEADAAFDEAIDNPPDHADSATRTVLRAVHRGNIMRCGDPFGPTVNCLRGEGKGWRDIRDSIARPDGKDLSLGKK